MLRLILLKLWPALIPLVAYLLWLRYNKRRAARGVETPPELIRGVRFWCIIASLALLAMSFIIVSLNQPAMQDGDYVPPSYDGSSITPAHSAPGGRP